MSPSPTPLITEGKIMSALKRAAMLGAFNHVFAVLTCGPHGAGHARLWSLFDHLRQPVRGLRQRTDM